MATEALLNSRGLAKLLLLTEPEAPRKDRQRFPMTSSGLVTVLLAGVVQSSVLTPMPYLRKWSWENMRLVYSVSAYLVLPRAFALMSVPHLFSTLDAAPSDIIWKTLGLGFIWGLAVVLYGLGINRLGLALGTAIILGLATSDGALVPQPLPSKRGTGRFEFFAVNTSCKVDV